MSERYDVIVVGYGLAGVSAAIEAVDRGAHVLALDCAYGGGASALSGETPSAYAPTGISVGCL